MHRNDRAVAQPICRLDSFCEIDFAMHSAILADFGITLGITVWKCQITKVMAEREGFEPSIQVLARITV
jgi:hypothetical protein